MIAIDESHCISSWGFDFRPSYKKLNVLKDWCKNVPILALTATATKKVRNDICKILRLQNPKRVIGSFDRPNLAIIVKKKTNIENDIFPLLEKYKDQNVIIYCKTKDDTDNIAKILQDNNIKAEAYHAGLNLTKRNVVQKKFIDGEINCLVATIAFGMGIDKKDIRLIIHYGCSQNLESYYQEIGRAGRDGKKSECCLFYGSKDSLLNSMFINDIEDVTYRAYQEEAKRDMEKYIYTYECRRKILLKHFDENYSNDKCNNCDNCLIEHNKKDFTYYGYLCLSLIKDNNDKSGMCLNIDILRGAKTKKIPQNMLEKYYYGKEKLTQDKWKDIFRLLILNGYLKERQVNKFGGSVISCTNNGFEWLKKINSKYTELSINTKFDINDKLMFIYNDEYDKKDNKDNKDEKIEIKPDNAGKKWTNDEDNELKDELIKMSLNEIADKHKRSLTSIQARLKHIIETYKNDGKSIKEISRLIKLKTKFIKYILNGDLSGMIIK